MSCRIRAVKYKTCVARPADAHPDLQDRNLLNYTRMGNPIKHARKH